MMLSEVSTLDLKCSSAQYTLALLSTSSDTIEPDIVVEWIARGSENSVKVEPTLISSLKRCIRWSFLLASSTWFVVGLEAHFIED